MFFQGVEDEEEEAEQYSDGDEVAPVVASEPQPSPTDDSPQGEKEEDMEGGGRSKVESKAEDKENLAGERQSGDGQVRCCLCRSAS